MKVAAVVVTYNRKDVLADCLRELLAQSRPLDEIIAVDNASTDGTYEVIRCEFADVTYVRLPENSGGAGGFHEGIKLACQKGYDWIWCMDDDGLPAPDALEKLLEHISEGVLLANCLVVSKQHPDRLAFSLPLYDSKGYPITWPRKRSVKFLSELKQCSNDGRTVWGANPFNGTLLSVEAIGLVGNVKREMFIQGDEIDMMWRLMKVGKVITVLDAIHYHPEKTGEMPLWKSYYALRNRIYVTNKYANLRVLRNLNLLRVYVPGFLRSWQGIKLLVRAVLDGYRGVLHSHIRPPSM
jgi:rhamnopyranosyl-N-acetylglucosaminyl-diphospho-decaprenol beta-1,3/1,4-galactofuranosyltransferase